MILSSFSKERMETLNKTSFPDLELPLNFKTIWVETLSYSGVNNTSSARLLHSHSFTEIHFVLSGTATYWLDEKLFEIKSGQALIIPSDNVHKCISCSEDSLKTTIAFSCDGDYFNESIIFSFDSETAESINKMFYLSEQDDVLARYILLGKTVEIIHTVLRSISAQIPKFTAQKHDPRFLAAKKFIEKNVHKKITCIEVAKECCLSPKQLNRIFYKETNASISKYINLTKIKSAKKLLLESDLSIKEITFMLGFENEGSFISFFKKHCSTTPALFRKQIS